MSVPMTSGNDAASRRIIQWILSQLQGGIPMAPPQGTTYNPTVLGTTPSTQAMPGVMSQYSPSVYETGTPTDMTQYRTPGFSTYRPINAVSPYDAEQWAAMRANAAAANAPTTPQPDLSKVSAADLANFISPYYNVSGMPYASYSSDYIKALSDLNDKVRQLPTDPTTGYLMTRPMQIALAQYQSDPSEKNQAVILALAEIAQNPDKTDIATLLKRKEFSSIRNDAENKNLLTAYQDNYMNPTDGYIALQEKVKTLYPELPAVTETWQVDPNVAARLGLARTKGAEAGMTELQVQQRQLEKNKQDYAKTEKPYVPKTRAEIRREIEQQWFNEAQRNPKYEKDGDFNKAMSSGEHDKFVAAQREQKKQAMAKEMAKQGATPDQIERYMKQAPNELLSFNQAALDRRKKKELENAVSARLMQEQERARNPQANMVGDPELRHQMALQEEMVRRAYEAQNAFAQQVAANMQASGSPFLSRTNMAKALEMANSASMIPTRKELAATAGGAFGLPQNVLDLLTQTSPVFNRK